MTSLAAIDEALREAQEAAYPAGEFVGQESFVLASDVLALARRAGVGPGTRVLDMCCGAGGLGRHITRHLGCRYLGVDVSTETVELARSRAIGMPCTYLVARVPPLPPGTFDVVLLIETFLAFPDKADLVAAIAQGLMPRGKFAFTIEEGEPLTDDERAAMPAAETVWPVPWAELADTLDAAGFELRWWADHTDRHLRVVDGLIDAFTTHRPRIDAVLGPEHLDVLLAGHRLWSRWMRSGRIRKLAVVAERHG